MRTGTERKVAAIPACKVGRLITRRGSKRAFVGPARAPPRRVRGTQGVVETATVSFLSLPVFSSRRYPPESSVSVFVSVVAKPSYRMRVGVLKSRGIVDTALDLRFFFPDFALCEFYRDAPGSRGLMKQKSTRLFSPFSRFLVATLLQDRVRKFESTECELRY